MTSDDGQPEVKVHHVVHGDGQTLLNRLIGSSNEGNVKINGQDFRALIDSGSMVTTISETGYNNLGEFCKPSLLSLDTLGLQESVADGSKLKYLGYIECSLTVSFLSGNEFLVPILVVPDTEFSLACPVIVGTNIIRLCRDLSSNNPSISNIPSECELAFNSIKLKLKQT